MPLPLLFIGFAAATGILGVGNVGRAGAYALRAKKINKNSNELITSAARTLDDQREACETSLSALGSEKLFVLNTSMTQFLDTFRKIKNVDFRNTQGIDELSNIHTDKKEFEDMHIMVDFAASLAGGAAAGVAGGVLTAVGAYGAAQTLACASTGTAIAALHGAAATNATLAFFGGGSLAAGGLGMAGGSVILGGLVAGPALMIMGLFTERAAKQKVIHAETNKTEAIEIATQLSAAAMECDAIRRRTYMFYKLLAQLDTYFLPLIYSMEDIVKNEGEDYSSYSENSKKVIASCASIAVTVKSLLDTPLLNDDGTLTNESGKTAESTEDYLSNLSLPA